MSAPTRTASVDGHDIFVFDDLVPVEEAAKYARAILGASFARTETARPERIEHRRDVQPADTRGMILSFIEGRYTLPE